MSTAMSWRVKRKRLWALRIRGFNSVLTCPEERQKAIDSGFYQNANGGLTLLMKWGSQVYTIWQPLLLGVPCVEGRTCQLLPLRAE